VWLLLAVTGCRVSFDPIADGGANSDARGFTVILGEAPTADIMGVTEDTVLSSSYATSSFGGRARLDLDDTWTPLLRFDTTSIPITATVLDARLSLWTETEATNDTVTVHRLEEPWSEGTNDGGAGGGWADFFNRQAGVPWTGVGATGGSRSIDITGSFFPFQIDAQYTFALALNSVQGWIDDPSTNFGLVFDSSGTDTVHFVSSEGATAAKRPLLQIVYMP
jgi:hypothetical protein